MNDKTKLVFRGFIELDPFEQSDFISELTKYQKASRELKESLAKSIRSDTTINFGPAPGGCPCCGR